MKKKMREKLENDNEKLLAYKRKVKKAIKAINAFEKPFNDFHSVGDNIEEMLEEYMDSDIIGACMYEDVVPEMRRDFERTIEAIDERISINKERLEEDS